MELARRRNWALAAVVVAAVAPTVTSCGGSEPARSSPAAATAPKVLRAVATLQAKSGAAIRGTATFEQVGNNPVRVRITVEHATPGLHGVHVHEKGDCSDPAAKAAGGHFNPGSSRHGGLETESRHAGDLGNIEIRENGTGDLVTTTDLFTVSAGRASVIGRSVVFHARQDDLKTQPSGNSGAREGCGVVRTSSP